MSLRRTRLPDPEEEAFHTLVHTICTNCIAAGATGADDIRAVVAKYRGRFPALTEDLVRGGIIATSVVHRQAALAAYYTTAGDATFGRMWGEARRDVGLGREGRTAAATGDAAPRRPSVQGAPAPPMQCGIITQLGGEEGSKNDGAEGRADQNDATGDRVAGRKRSRSPSDEQSSERYPNGNVTLTVKKGDKRMTVSASGKQRRTMPVVSWAKHKVNGRSGKYACLGVWKCPVDGCEFGEKPRIPRDGKSKYSTKGQLPRPKRTSCTVHPTSHIVHVQCPCYWFVRDRDEDHWEIEHFGKHNHAAVWEKGRSQLERKSGEK